MIISMKGDTTDLFATDFLLMCENKNTWDQ